MSIGADRIEEILKDVAPDAEGLSNLAKELHESGKVTEEAVEGFTSGLKETLAKEGSDITKAVEQFAEHGKFEGAVKEAGRFAKMFLHEPAQKISFNNVKKVNAALAVAGTYAAYKVLQSALGGGQEQSIN